MKIEEQYQTFAETLYFVLWALVKSGRPLKVTELKPLIPQVDMDDFDESDQEPGPRRWWVRNTCRMAAAPRAGLLKRVSIKGRGRPAEGYELTDAARKLLETDDSLIGGKVYSAERQIKRELKRHYLNIWAWADYNWERAEGLSGEEVLEIVPSNEDAEDEIGERLTDLIETIGEGFPMMKVREGLRSRSLTILSKYMGKLEEEGYVVVKRKGKTLCVYKGPRWDEEDTSAAS